MQLKSDSISSPIMNISDPCAKIGVFTSKTNLKNLIIGKDNEGNLTLQVYIMDFGEHGLDDKIAIF